MSTNLMTHMSDEEHEALSKRGLDLYEGTLKALLEPAYNNQYVAIHIDTEQYAVGRSSGDAMRAMRKRRPDGRLVIMQIGAEPEWGLAARLLAGQMIAGQQK